MTGFNSLRVTLPADRSGEISRVVTNRRPVAPRRFVPRVADLETRQLLSQLVVTSNADSGPGSFAQVGAATLGDVITFAGSLRGQTITLASPLLIDTSLTIRGLPQVTADDQR